MKRLIPLIILAIACLPLEAQNWVDALRYSQTFAGGTARSTAMGGAFGALGGDFYSVSQNPAGLGVYRSSEFTFTPELYYNKTTSRYIGNEVEDYKYNFNISNLGYVATFNKNKDEGFIGGSFAFGFNRLNNYHSNIIIEGVNTESSLGDLYVNSANYGEGIGPVDPVDLLPFSEGLFYDSYVMDYDTVIGQYFLNEYMKNADGSYNIDQRNVLQRSGKMNEWVFSAGFNYGHFLYFGATFSITPIRFEERSNFTEFANTEYNDQFNYYEKLKIRGTGYSGKFGIIVKPISLLRLGVAFHTPVAYYINELYEANIYSSFTGEITYPQDGYGNTIYDAENDYKIVTPYKVIGSAGVTLGKFAIISTDLEFIDYSSMRLRKGGDGYDFYEENQGVEAIYKSAFNIKTGVEFRIDKLYLRGGFGYYGSPYKESEINFDAYQYNYSAGIGFRDKNVIVGFAWSYKIYDERYILYQMDGRRPYTSNLDSKTSRFLLTLGFRF